MKQQSLIEKILHDINWSVGLIIITAYTFTMSFSKITPRIDQCFTLVVLWCITVVLIGSVLCLFSLIISLIVAYAKKDPAMSNRGYLPPGAEAGFRSAYKATGLSTAYTMFLYLLGFTESYFSFMMFYT